MTKHAAYPSEDMVAAVAAPAPAGRHFTSFQPLKSASLDCKKHASGAAVVGGSWFESMKASSPRCAADAEHGDDWMVLPPAARRRLLLLLCARSEIDRSTPHFRPAASAGEAPVGIGQLRVAARRRQGEADRDVPGLRRHSVTDRRGPRPRRHVGGGQQQSSPRFLFFPMQKTPLLKVALLYSPTMAACSDFVSFFTSLR